MKMSEKPVMLDDFRVTSKGVKIARFPHATGTPSARSCLVPHPSTAIEHVVEESLTKSLLLKGNMRLLAGLVLIICRTMNLFGLKSTR